MTGQLKTLAELDYEVDNPPKTSYMVTVTVIDGKNAENTVDTTTVDDTITVTIMVTDVNEAPEFPTIEPAPALEWLRTQCQTQTSAPRW